MKILNVVWNRGQHRLRLIPRLAFFLLIYKLLDFIFYWVIRLGSAYWTYGNLVTSGLIKAGLTALTLFLGGLLLDRRPFADFGFHINRRWWKDLLFGCLLGALLMAAIFLLEWALGWVRINEFFGTNTALSSIPPRAYFWSQFSQSLLFYFLAALSEEMFFRAYPFKNIVEGFQNRKINKKQAAWLAALLTSIVFGLAHLANPHASWISTVNIIAAGLMLCMGFIYTGEAALSIGLHYTWNFFQGVIFGFHISGTVAPANLLRIEQSGPTLLTGGSFGPEAGMVGLAAMILGSFVIIWYCLKFRRSN